MLALLAAAPKGPLDTWSPTLFALLALLLPLIALVIVLAFTVDSRRVSADDERDQGQEQREECEQGRAPGVEWTLGRRGEQGEHHSPARLLAVRVDGETA